MSAREDSAPQRALARTATVALVARLAVVAVARNRFPAADDGALYDTLGKRLAHGLGYSWVWPDGAVTSVAHYPVGYPWLLAFAYRVFGEHLASALVLHAFIGAAGAVAVHYVAAAGSSARAGSFAGLAVALHPALLTYTPAIMTEGVTSSLLAIPFAVAVLARRSEGPARGLLLMLSGLLVGVIALVRPEALVFVPVVAIAALPHAAWRAGSLAVLLVAFGAVIAVAPWTLRNQRVLGQPVLISANGGWNLWIGTDREAGGAWRALDPPAACREVWGEAEKDSCFAGAARRRILDQPLDWLLLAPAKLAATFDLGGSGPSYLSRARPDLVPRGAVLAIGGFETLVERLAVLLALVGLSLERGRRRCARLAIGGVSAVWLVLPHAWPAYVGLALQLTMRGRRELLGSPIRLVTCGVVAATAATHVVFFGAGRYAMLVYPWVAALACTAGPFRRLRDDPG